LIDQYGRQVSGSNHREDPRVGRGALEGLRCIAAPVKDSSDETLGAISVSAPASRVSDDDRHGQLPERVLSATNVVELNTTTDQAFRHSERLFRGFYAPIRATLPPSTMDIGRFSR